MTNIAYYDHLCACGCGNKIAKKDYHNKKGYKIPTFLPGHHMKLDKYKKLNHILKEDYVPWNKGKKCPQISKSKMGKRNPMYGKIGVDNPCFGRKMSEETRKKQREQKLGDKNPRYWKNKKRSKETKSKISQTLTGKKLSEETLNKLSISRKRKIEIIKKKHPFFSKIEEMRYNPDKPREKEIQVHCKNHNCPNSREQGGWFTPTSRQIEQRIWSLENEKGNDGLFFYCSIKCKQECPLYNLKSDPLKENENPYNPSEYQTFREFVLERDNYKCQYCGKAAEHVHHERPQKLEPFFALDPDLAWSVCKECHFKYGHPKESECSIGKLSYLNC